MPTLLQLTQSLERESGTIYQNQRLRTVVGAAGRHEKMIEWIIEAWRIIQMARADWPWMRREFSHALVTGTARYTPAALGITDFSRWALGDPGFAIAPPDNPSVMQDLRSAPFAQWKAKWTRGVYDPMQPQDFAVDYDGRLCFGPTPDKAYIVSGEYYRSAQILSADSDVPILPSDHHMAIVWRAVMLMGDHDEAPAAVATGKAKYDQALRNLIDTAMPEAYL
jgi:hypothetical protein